MKKALELSILCRCEIGIIVFSSNGNLHQWSSPRTSMKDLLQRYSEATTQGDPFQAGKEVGPPVDFHRPAASFAGSSNPDAHPGAQVLDVPSDFGSDADDVGEADDEQDVTPCLKRKVCKRQYPQFLPTIIPSQLPHVN